MRIKDKITLEEKRQKTYQFFVDKGLSPTQAAALTGNFAVESGFNTRIEGDKNLSSSSLGLAQWRETRLDRLKSMYDDPYSLDSQLDFVWWELNNSHRHALKALQEAETPEQAAIAVRSKYEVAWDKHDDRRIQETKNVLARFNPIVPQTTAFQKATDTIPEPPQRKIDNTQVTQKVINFPKQAGFPTFTGQQEEKKQETTSTPTDKAKETLESKKSEMQFLKDLMASRIPVPKQLEQQTQQPPVQPYGSFILNKARELGVFQEGGELSEKEISDIEKYVQLTQELGKQRLLQMQVDRTANTWGNMLGNVGQYFFGIEDKDLVESPYTPTVTSNSGQDTKYYTRPGLKEDVYRDLVSYEVQRDYNHSDKFSDIYKALLSNGEDREHNAEESFPKNSAGYKGMYNLGHGSFKGEFNLGRYKVDAGEDDKGKYISFYDVYDWNGFQQENKIPLYDRIYEDEWEEYQKKTKNQSKAGLKPTKDK